jgi:hypothetical protein
MTQPTDPVAEALPPGQPKHPNPLANPLTRAWLARSLEQLAPALREIAGLLTGPNIRDVRDEDLITAASVLERTARLLPLIDVDKL